MQDLPELSIKWEMQCYGDTLSVYINSEVGLDLTA